MKNELQTKNNLIKKFKEYYPDNPNIEKAVEFVFDYKSDDFFKYALTHSKMIRNIMCQYILPDDIRLKDTIVVDSHLYKQNVNDKPSILDILAQDESGNQYNIEMQCHNITSSDFKRFQYYAIRNISSQLLDVKGKYESLKPTYQLIINGTGKDALNLNHFEYHFNLCDRCHHLELPHSLFSTSYIQLHHIDEIIKKDNLSAFLQIMYVFKTNGKDDIIDTEVVKELKTMHATYSENYARIVASIEDEINRMYWDVKMEEAMETGTKQGLEQGLEQGLQQGLEQGLKQGLKQGIQQGILQGMLIQKYKSHLLTDTECATQLNLSKEEFIELVNQYD